MNVINVKLMTIMKDVKQGESWKVGNEAFIWSSLLMSEKSGKIISNPTKPIIWYTSCGGYIFF